MKKVFTAYSDPQHSWVKVPKKLLNDLSISDKITKYSYQRGEFAYLEEDCDLTLFHNTFKEKFGIEPIYKTKWTNKQSKIRNYERFKNE